MPASSALAWTLACALLPVVACIIAGATVGGDKRWPGADMLVGFGLLGAALSILAVTTRLPLSLLMAGLAALAMVALVARRRFPGSRATWIALALVSPMLIGAARSEAAMWDEFWNWLPSAAYAYRQDSVAWPDLVPSLSIFPGYPQGMPLMIAAASFIAGGFLEAAGPIVNVALLAGVSALFAEALAAALVRRGRLAEREMPLVLVACAVAITTLLNPGLDGTVVLSSYADCATMVAVGALGLIGLEILARLSSDPVDVSGLAWRFGLIAAMLLNLKQANPILLALIVAGLILAAWRDPAIKAQSVLAQLPRMLGPAVVLFAVWRWYVVQNLPDSEQAFRPVYDWNFGVLGHTLVSIRDLVADAPVFHILMWLVTAVGVATLLFRPHNASEARRLAVVCATVWLGYNIFLLVAYAGAMQLPDAEIAADYWRYTPHVALLGLYTPAIAVATGPWPARMATMKLRGAGPALAAVLLAVCAMPVRSDLNSPSGRDWQHFLRAATIEIRQIVPPGSKVLIVSTDNSSPFAVAVRYNLWQLGMADQQIQPTILWRDEDLSQAKSWKEGGGADYLLIQDAEGVMDATIDALGLPPIDHELALFVWRHEGWQKIKSWPVPAGVIRREQ
jgi:hypothetical protein